MTKSRKSKRTKSTSNRNSTAGVRVTEAEFESLLHHSSGRIYCAIMLAFRHGMRVAEVCKLLREDVDLKARTITVRHLKGSNTVTQPLSDLEVSTVRELLAASPESPFVFTSRKHKMQNELSPTTLFNDFVEVAKKAGLPPHKRHFHVLRHGLGFALAEKGVPLNYIQMALGHKSIGSAAIYSRPSQEAVDKAMAAVLGN
jgi:integrase